jgi:hypothetical protein
MPIVLQRQEEDISRLTPSYDRLSHSATVFGTLHRRLREVRASDAANRPASLDTVRLINIDSVTLFTTVNLRSISG